MCNTSQLEGYPPEEVCSVCKGRCCKERGCSLSPDDLKAALKEPFEQSSLEQLLQKEDNMFAIDMTHFKDKTFYYLRMRTKHYTFIGLEGMGECCALTNEGCLLSEADRPKGGRFLKPSSDFRCNQEYTAEQMCRDWEPYQAQLAAIWDKYATQFEQDGTMEKCDRAYFASIRDGSRDKRTVPKEAISY